jgi:hypothetical protein
MAIRLLFASGLAGLLGLVSTSVPAQDAKPQLPADIIPSAFRAYLVTDGRFPPVKVEGKEPQQDPRTRIGKIHCLVCENGLAPVIAIFVRTDPPSIDADHKGFDDLILKTNAMIADPKYRASKLAAFVTFLRLEGAPKIVTLKTIQDGNEVETKVEQDQEYPDDEKRDDYSSKIRDFAAALNAPNVPFGLAADKSKALKEWGVKDDDEVTVIAYYRMRKIHEPWRFKSSKDITDADVNAILKSVQSALADR